MLISLYTDKHFFIMNSKKSSVVNGLFWAFLDQFSSKGLSIIVSIILARILSPNDFGMMGLIYFFTAIAQELVDSGLSSSLIRDKNADKKDYGTIFISNLFFSIIIYLIVFAIAPYFASYYSIPELESILKIYGLIFIINAFSNVQLTLLNKELQFKKTLLITLPGIVIGSLSAIYFAFNNYGVWSIVYMQLISQLITTIILWINNKNVILYFSTRILKKHFDFGFKIMLSSLVNAVFRNVSNIVIGKNYSVTDLGYFERSRTLSMYPSYVFVGVLSKVFYPVFSKINDEDELNKGYKKVLNLSFYITFSFMLLTAAIAYPLIGLVLGVKWLFAVPFFQILCLRAAIHPLQVFNLNILKVKGLSNQLFKLELINRCIGLLALFIGVYFDLYILVILLTITDFLAYFINTLNTQKHHKYKLKQQLLDFMPTVIIACIGFILCIVFQHYYFNIQSLLGLSLQTLLFITTFLVLSMVSKNKNAGFIIAAIQSKLNFKR